ncbi:hypothetical protein FM996_14165 [Methylosinus sporium]|uniref:Uncharacterized protein n=1 Tax=Methylosinus sporium TaxID=428 RepID=A0A549SNE5_METSR|nr:MULTISPECIES: hypothetical protein [Methylosinus]MBU3887554.1 hypothetical protein [Methylosinus sp. KRF6]TRL31128.1 hypothetical protein FM996_14165 [Methylosinus sporium]
MIDVVENLAQSLFVSLGSRSEPWDEAPLAERDRYRLAAENILRELAARAPFEPTSLVRKIRETRPTFLGFLYMTYSLNTAEAAALLAFQALRGQFRRSAAA